MHLLTVVFLQLLSVFCGALAHGGANDQAAAKPVDKLSLPDLIHAKSIPSNWESIDNTKLEEGRIILTPSANSKGSLWLKSPFKLQKSFTVEWTVRSINYVGKTNGGMAMWFISSDDYKNDKSLYNGPSKFDGLQLAIDNNGPMGQSIKAQLNDNSESLAKADIHSKTFGSCLLGYQDASVPITIRLTYDNDDINKNHLLKLQIDNKVCFQTRKINLPNNVDYYIGVSADNDNTNESFEVLQMNFYDTVIEDSLIPNVNSMNQPKLITKIVDKDTGKEKLVDKEILDSQNTQISNFELFKKMDKLEGEILSNDISSLETKINEIASIQDELTKAVLELGKHLQQITSGNGNGKEHPDTKEEFKDFIAMNEKLEKMLDEQAKIREATKQQQLFHSNGPQIDEIVRKLTFWIIPLIVIMLVMVYYTFTIRREITKTKLL
ncbi:hypothetical protein KAFR_0C03690 [Kazachstania africana CBS 2517]|uniref:L-type lectin-like domain-containing protein n=1 Tax=Kazachstania africana (strain ATCC 22294 / BCRC 22015 / CBS 2517 / CECT 1963 / NBRC 1671 / NRRL Y-8276) TaxID=1071382 RepID=H2ASL1_KAZAF|nr:hypothetical protein KAFR_0C03690 [Kazachstania africana CBS 2517]CCF57361.1 hypothetical protein KAFR_0C03690 [Kazachstania africana CBS 2517]